MAESPPGNDLARLIGLILIVIGTLWLVLTGLCSGAFLIGFLGQGNLSDIGAVFAIGIPSALIGGIVYAIGRWLRPST
ncbi:MAG: hypothetical protein ACKVRO_03860 [Micropepsaceae bacterium]